MPRDSRAGAAHDNTAVRRARGDALFLASISTFQLNVDYTLFSVLIGVLLGLTVRYWRAPLPFASIIAFLFVSSHYFNSEDFSIYMVRNFFGVLSVTETSDGRFRVLWHGTTGQGSQRIRDDDGNPVSAGRK